MKVFISVLALIAVAAAAFMVWKKTRETEDLVAKNLHYRGVY